MDKSNQYQVIALLWMVIALLGGPLTAALSAPQIIAVVTSVLYAATSFYYACKGS